ncbi:hypothetical protein DVR12_05875 [Chitinophaga silvatica]|uniref:PKD-like family protein n=1 Tax=Chitinophaga silvatica TaxID=2282649 RepID=A0A3E1YDT5_9BACT|nr:PKD-like family lipoprotein [Chitinophaga silvatica]RFS24725.1 hypothetical protein DVR12_05875 [Chitinophaga silvatica]
MQRNYKLFLFLLALVIIANACMKDKGNYSYKELNKIDISVSSDTVYVTQFDSLKIAPVISQLPDKSQLTYSWYYYSQRPDYPGINYISTSEKLNVQIGSLPGSYTLYLKVTDEATGVNSWHRFTLIVTSSISNGWLVWYNTSADSSDAAIIQPSGKTLYNLFQNANGRQLPGEARQVTCLTAGWMKQYIFCLTDKAGAYINPFDFRQLVSFNDSGFYTKPTTFDYQALYPNPGKDFISDYLFKEKKVLTRIWTGPFAVAKYGAALGGDYEAAPYLMGSPYTDFGPYPTVVFDEKHHRFIYTPLNETTFSTFPSNPKAAFDINNVGNRTMLYAYNSPNGQSTALLRDKSNDSVFIYQLDFSRGNSDKNQTPAISVMGIDKSPDMAKAKFFALSPILPLLFYANDNKIYKYDIAANSSTLLYTFSAGIQITAFSILNPQLISNPMFTPANLGKRLAVATTDGKTGSVYEFSILPSGSFEGATYTNKYDGFGVIKSIYYKINL